MSNKIESHYGTQAVWAGETRDNPEDATQVPIIQSVSFGYRDVDAWCAVAREQREGYIYSRNKNPTVRHLEDKISGMEGTEAGLAFSSGMGAISNTLFSLLSPGDRVVTQKDTYGGTSKLFMEFLPRFNIEVKLCETAGHEAMEAEMAKGCRLLYLESPTNPTLKITDLTRLAKAAKKGGAVVVVDNTFATPVLQNPIALGADLVIHSATKYLGGHADVLGGIVCGQKKLIGQIYHFREINGCIIHPMSAYLLLRSMKTLALRINQQCKSAMEIARFLQSHEKIGEVFYPGLPEHLNHTIARQQMRDFGGMLSFTLKGGFNAIRKFLPQLKYAHLAANLGAVETLAGIPETTSHVECSREERQALGIPEGLVRYSVGIEDTHDLIKDLEQALQSV